MSGSREKSSPTAGGDRVVQVKRVDVLSVQVRTKRRARRRVIAELPSLAEMQRVRRARQRQDVIARQAIDHITMPGTTE